MAQYKHEAYEQAIAFRKRGFTYAEIAKICNVSKGTVSNWLKHETFSQTVAASNKKQAVALNTKRLALINKARVSERKHQYAEIVRLAETEYKHYRTAPLFCAGLMLYIAEGDRANPRMIRMANNRPELHHIFIRFLTAYLGIAKTDIHFWLLLYKDHNEVACMKHWCKKTGLSPAQFYKNQVIDARSHHKTLHFGVGNTIVSNTLLKMKLKQWMDMFTTELKK